MNQIDQIQKQHQQQENNAVQYPPTTVETTYPYSVRIEKSAKGARISIHCYNRHLKLAAREAIEAFLSHRRQLKELGCTGGSGENEAGDLMSATVAAITDILGPWFLVAGKDDEGKTIQWRKMVRRVRRFIGFKVEIFGTAMQKKKTHTYNV